MPRYMHSKAHVSVSVCVLCSKMYNVYVHITLLSLLEGKHFIRFKIKEKYDN